MLKTQLVLKGVMTIDEFHNIKELIQFDFLQDGHFTELKEAELMENKLQTLQSIESYVGTFFSKKWVQNNVLRLTDTEIEDMQNQMNKEAGLDPDDGGVDVPDNTDGITRYPQDGDGGYISPDDMMPSDGVNNKGENDGGN